MFVDDWTDLIQLTGIVKNRLTFIFHEIDDEATVYSVFEVLNSRGLSVPWLDRLKSLLMGIAFEHGSGNKAEIIEELHGIWEGVYRTIGLRQGLSTEALRFAATLKSNSQRSKALGEEEAVESLVSQCNSDPVKTVETSHWILQVSKAVEEFLSTAHRSKAVTRIAHARLLAVAIGLANFPADDKKRLLGVWEKISFRVFGLCRKDARTQVGEYVRLAWDCLYEGWEEELRYLMYRYEEDHSDIHITNEQWGRIWEQSASHSIEHIQAQETGAKFVHRLGNLMLLPPGLNSRLSAKKPIDKIDEYRATGLYGASEVAKTIEVNGWKLAQIEEREKRILDWVKTTWA